MIESIFLILLFGMLGSYVFSWMRLPGLLGMIIVGVLIGPYGFEWLSPQIMEAAGEIRMIALVIILLRAGLGMEKALLKEVGVIAAKMSALPCLIEGFLVAIVAWKLLNMPFTHAGVLGFILAAVSPAVIVPSMLYLKEKGLGMRKGVPIIILAGASVDDVFAISMFTAFMGISMHSDQGLLFQIGLIPLRILAGVAIGIGFGWVLGKTMKYQKWRIAEMEKIAFVLCFAILVYIIGERWNLAGLLGVLVFGFMLLEKTNHIAVQIERELNKAWFFAQIFLFVLIGAEVNIPVAWEAGMMGLLIIGIGLAGRFSGVFIALLRSSLNQRERLFCAISYTPKATVQAAIGGIPLAMGIEKGESILAIAVLSIVVTAPLGAIGIKISAPRLLEKEAEGV